MKEMKFIMYLVIIALLTVFSFGCATIQNLGNALNNPESPLYWDNLYKVAEQYFDAKAEQVKAEEAVAENPTATDEDRLFASFQWRHGGFNGSAAKSSLPRLSLVNASKSGISYTWNVGMSVWGYANTECGGIACIFFKDSSGNWIGGKFDWVSTSRPYRDFAHIFGSTPYSNWGSLDWNQFPATIEFAFVVVEQKGKLRSNILTGSFAR